MEILEKITQNQFRNLEQCFVYYVADNNINDWKYLLPYQWSVLLLLGRLFYKSIKNEIWEVKE